MVTTILNIALSLILIQFIGVVGIALATGLMGWLQFGLLRHKCRDIEAARFDDRFKKVFLKILISCGVMAVVLFGVNHFVVLNEAGEMVKAGTLMGLVALGGFVYSAGVLGTGAIKLSEIKTYLKRK